MAKFYIVGAGPGDPGLLTIRAAEALRTADVVLYDRLVSEDVLNLLKSTAQKIFVGKHPGEQDQVQHDIYKQFLNLAKEDKTVVRLKGGDPMIFGRGAEEWLFLKELGAEVELIPGVSSAIGVPGRVGIPLTAREVSRSFSVVTGHCCGADKVDWSKYANIDTLVVLMGVKERAHIASELIASGREPSQPVAFVENGSLPNERVVYATLGAVAAGSVEASSPAVFVIGDVVEFGKEVLDKVQSSAVEACSV